MNIKEATAILKKAGYIVETTKLKKTSGGTVHWPNGYGSSKWSVNESEWESELEFTEFDIDNKYFPDELINNLFEMQDSGEEIPKFTIEFTANIIQHNNEFDEQNDEVDDYKIDNIDDIPEIYKPYVDDIMENYINSENFWDAFYADDESNDYDAYAAYKEEQAEERWLEYRSGNI